MFYLTFYPYNVICNIEKVPSTNELNKLIWIVWFETQYACINIVNYEGFLISLFFIIPFESREICVLYGIWIGPCSSLSHLICHCILMKKVY